jgi:DNA-binding beta-propeller fold protein YncE
MTTRLVVPAIVFALSILGRGPAAAQGDVVQMLFPRWGALSPDSAYVYVAALDTVLVFRRDGAGLLEFVEEVSIPGNPDLLMSPNGAHLYVSSGGLEDTVATYSRDGGTGVLSFENEVAVDVFTNTTVSAVSPDGAHVYIHIEKFGDDELQVFARDDLSGALTPVQTITAVDGAGELSEAVVVSPDGGHVYETGQHDTIIAFARAPGTGELTKIQTLVDGVGGVDGIADSRGAAVSPDGEHLYVTGPIDDAVGVFDRDAGTGTLSFVETQVDGTGGVDGLDAAWAVSVSPDGKHVYVTSVGDDALAVFSRDAVTGSLAFVEAHFDGADGVNGLAQPEWVMVSPDGAYVYVAAVEDDAVGVFGRDAVTGELTFLQAKRITLHRLSGKRFVLENVVPDVPDRNSVSWLTVDEAITAGEHESLDDPRCNLTPPGTVKARVRIFSDSSGHDSGVIPLPCQNWTANSPNAAGKVVYRYKDGELDDGPCRRVILQAGPQTGRIKISCLGRGPTTDFAYDLMPGTDEGVITAILEVRARTYCVEFDDFNGRDGSDGEKFQGKNATPPSTCFEIGSPSGAFLNLAEGLLQ